MKALTKTKGRIMLRVILWIVGIIFIIGLLVTTGVLKMIF